MMARDIQINEQLQTEWNTVGDFDDVDGAAQIRQSISIFLIENADTTPPALHATAIEQRRGEIEQAVKDCSLTDPPIRVDVGEIDYEAQAVTYNIFTNRVAVSTTLS